MGICVPFNYKNKMPKALTRRQQITKMHVKFYKQFRTLALKQFKELQAFYENEDTVALQKRMVKPRDV